MLGIRFLGLLGSLGPDLNTYQGQFEFSNTSHLVAACFHSLFHPFILSTSFCPLSPGLPVILNSLA